jgi:glycyl-tRNA synthetase beta chain
MDSLLIEIRAEEIPAGYIQPALDFFASNLDRRLSDARIEHGKVITYGTPRRLTVLIDNVSPKQQALTTEVIGPPEAVGYDADGKPTVAAEKFAEKVGMAVSKIRVKTTEKGRYLCAVKRERGRSTRTILKTMLPEVIPAIPFPKKMRWSDLPIEFARPIHHILALYGTQIVSFRLGNVKSGRLTTGHSFMSPGRIKIEHPADYSDQLRRAGVVVDIDARRELVRESVEAAAAQAGGAVMADEALLDIVTNLVEYPYPVIGRFEEKFLDLPSEILITAMREHQKYFAVTDSAGQLMPCFIAVNNTRTKDMGLVAIGHERVIRARLEDARFFYQADMKRSFDDWVGALKGVLFQAKLGSMYDKVSRVRTLAGYLSDSADVAAQDKTDIDRAAYLCKADLLSEVVGEFPNLQGVMGRVYANAKGESSRVAAAIEEHYRPVRSGGDLPRSAVGALLAVADKTDSICGCFSAGLIPTGATDPYALRRQGIGIIQIMLDKGITVPLKELIRRACEPFVQSGLQEFSDTPDRVYTFLKNRISHLLAEEGYSKDVIAAVAEVSVDNVPDVWNRVRALEALKRAADFEPVAVAFKRVVNIIKQAGHDAVDTVNPSLFDHPSEAALHQAYGRVSQVVSQRLRKGEFDQALHAIAGLRNPVDDFFDGVMVMTDDLSLRRNRLALLAEIAALFDGVADFSKIAT